MNYLQSKSYSYITPFKTKTPHSFCLGTASLDPLATLEMCPLHAYVYFSFPALFVLILKCVGLQVYF